MTCRSVLGMADAHAGPAGLGARVRRVAAWAAGPTLVVATLAACQGFGGATRHGWSSPAWAGYTGGVARPVVMPATPTARELPVAPPRTGRGAGRVTAGLTTAGPDLHVSRAARAAGRLRSPLAAEAALRSPYACSDTRLAITPCLTTDSATFNTTDSTVFTVKNKDVVDITVTPSAVCPSSGTFPLITSCTVGVGATLVPAGQQRQFAVRYTLGTPVFSDSTQLVSLHLAYTASSGSGTLEADVVVRGRWFRLDFSPGAESRDLALCVAACFAAHYEQTTYGYRSLDVARGVTLVYAGETVRPRPFVHADLTTNATFPSTGMLIMTATINNLAMAFTNGDTRLFFDSVNTARKVRLGGQLDLSTYATGLYPLTLKVRDSSRAFDGFQVSGALTLGRLLPVINGMDSPVARGWGIKGVQRRYKVGTTEALVVDGDGSFTRFTNGRPTGSSSDLSTLGVGDSIRYYQDGTEVYFNTAGYMTKVVDGKSGLITGFLYEAWSGGQRLKQITDPYRGTSGMTVLYYGANGLDSIVAPGRTLTSGGTRLTKVRVNASRYLTAIVDPDNDSTRFTYDASDQLQTVVDRQGTVRQTYTYNGSTRLLASVVGPTVPVDQGTGSTVSSTPITSYSPWQLAGVPTGPTSATSLAAWGDTLRTASVTDPAGTTNLVLDPWGQPTKTTDPVGRVTTAVRATRPNYYYDAYGTAHVEQALSPLSSRVAHPDSTIDTYGYDFSWPVIRLLWEQHPGQSAVYYAYRAENQTLNGYPPLIDSTWGLGTAPTRYYYSTALLPYGLPDSVRALTTTSMVFNGTPVTMSTWTRYTYDAVHRRPASVKDQAGNITTYVYDATFGNLAQTVIPGGRKAVTTFDAYGRAASDSAPQSVTVLTTYDGVDRPLQRVRVRLSDGVRDSVMYRYDALYDTLVVDARGYTYRTARDVLGRPAREYAPNSATRFRSYRYDLAGRLTGTTNRRGQRLQLTYDGAGRLLTRQRADSAVADIRDSLTYAVLPYTWGTRVVAWNGVARDTVDGERATAARTGVRAVTRFTTDATTPPFVVTQSAVDTWTGNDSIAVSEGTPDVYPAVMHQKVAYVFGGQTTSILDGSTPPETQSFDLTQRPWGTALFGNRGSERVQAYTRSSRAAYVDYTDSAVDTAFRHAYARDSLDRVSLVQWGLGTGWQRRLQYDAYGRLSGFTDYHGCSSWPGTIDSTFGWSSACTTTDSSRTYAYDAAGNQTGFFAVADSANALVRFGRYKFTYDADGNLTQKWDTVANRTWTYRWDALSRLVYVRRPGATAGTQGDSIQYEYDALGRLARRRRNGVIDRHWLYVGSHIEAELDGTLRRRVQYTYQQGTDRPQAALVANGTGYTLHRSVLDEVGNVVGQVTGTAVTQRVAYDPWGKPLFQVNASGNKLLWKGLMYEDTVGLYYVRNRWYDPDVGRFLSEDPIGIEGGINLYAFGNNDPINYADPYGTCPMYLTGRPCLNPLAEDLMIRSTSGNPKIGCYGYVRNGGTKVHQGLDLLSPTSADVFAVDKGVVVFDGSQTGYGNLIIIAHYKNGARPGARPVSYSAYAHLSGSSVSVGDQVTAGQLIGHSGISGNGGGTAPHLHFELRTANPVGRGLSGRVNPYGYLEDFFANSSPVCR